MKKRSPRYCYLTPSFPDQAYMVILFIDFNNKDVSLMPVTYIFTNISDICTYINELSVNIYDKKQIDNPNINEKAVLYPVKFLQRYPLKREHWVDPATVVKEFDRVSAFVKATTNMKFYKLLVLPYKYEKKEWKLTAAYPFSLFAEDAEIEEYMFNSDQIVDVKADSAGLYIFDTPKILHWKNGEVHETNEPIRKKPKIES